MSGRLRELPLEGVQVWELRVLPDERGFFAEALRSDWGEFVDEWVVQVNVSYSYPGEVVASGRKPVVVRVPGEYWHGTKTVSDTPSLTVYFVTRLYDYGDPDEERRPWDDPGVVPVEINGRRDDPRCGRPWDWFYPPHR